MTAIALPSFRRRKSKPQQAAEAAVKIWTAMKAGAAAAGTAKKGAKAYAVYTVGKRGAKLLVIPIAAGGGFAPYKKLTSSSSDEPATPHRSPPRPAATPATVTPPKTAPRSAAAARGGAPPEAPPGSGRAPHGGGGDPRPAGGRDDPAAAARRALVATAAEPGELWDLRNLAQARRLCDFMFEQVPRHPGPAVLE